jgi:hypothetical protein
VQLLEYVSSKAGYLNPSVTEYAWHQLRNIILWAKVETAMSIKPSVSLTEALTAPNVGGWGGFLRHPYIKYETYVL